MSGVQELLSRELRVLMRGQDCKERQQSVRICIELHVATTPIHKKDLVVRLTDDTDLLFLYNLIISEDDFQSLKLQQSLLVDYTAFPQKFIDLLHQCVNEESKDAPRFLLQLSYSGPVLGSSPAQLDVIETNSFKHLTHLSLRFQPANDVEVKTYLATCLRCIKDEKCVLQQALKKTEEDLSRQLIFAQQALSDKMIELEKLKTDTSLKISELTSQHTTESTSEKEKAQQAYAQLLQQYEQQRREFDCSLQKSTQQMQSRVSELEQSNKELLERRYKSESTVRELRSKFQGLEEELQRAQQKVSSLGRENTSLDAECHDKEKEMNRLQTRLAVLEQELKDKDQIVQRSNEILSATQQQKIGLESSGEKKQAQVERLEATIQSLSAELLKANSIIKKLQGDLKTLISKLKLKNAVTVQQEKHLSEKEKLIQERENNIVDVQHSLHVKEEEVEKLHERLQETEQKLEESKELLKTNENVISWLNKQLNETHSVGLNPSNAPFRATVSPNQMPDNRIPGHHNTRINYPLPSYPVIPIVPAPVSSHQTSLDMRCPSMRVHYNNPLTKINPPQSLSGSTQSANKENGESAGLDLKYLKKREVGLPLHGLNQNTAPEPQKALRTVTHVKTGPPIQSAYFPGQVSSL
ncbi:PREDICTED: spindle assembly abnormal protein 6 homolog [Nanorana parkeri]|uniref:spindle assembly abnormal protein 6 homolog n=1 Tax=Nanorana parkeri TaxID=125878 RepID=UPI000854D8A1|nr:PREDICTED: spindle assembly abnormal protein 6 homolog [Nanorana parkeri]